MGEVIDLAGQLAGLEADQDFVTDLCRFSESLLTESAVRKKYRLAESTWLILGENDSLVEKIEAEKIRRIRDGSAKREKSQQLIVKAPAILDTIMSDPAASPRHRVDAIKTLDTFAANNPGNAVPATDRFQITINLGNDHVLHFDKSIELTTNDRDDGDTGITSTPWGMFAISTKKDDGGGEFI